MHLTAFPGGHELDRVPPGAARVPLSTLDGLRATPGDGDGEVWVHSDRPGLYAVVRGGGALAEARRRGDRSVRLRVTHHPRWRSARAPADALVVLDPPGRAGRPGAPLGPADLARRLGAPAAGPAPDVAGLPADAALAALVARGEAPVAWLALRWTPPGADRAVSAHPPSAAAAVRAASCAAAVEAGFAAMTRAAACLAPWGAQVGPSRTLLVRDRAGFAEAAAQGVGAALGPEGASLGDLGALLARSATAEARAWADAAAALLPGPPWSGAGRGGAPRAADVLRGALLWEAAVAAGARVPSAAPGAGPGESELARRRAGAPWAELPSPYPHLLAAYAAGAAPVALDGRGAVLALPGA